MLIKELVYEKYNYRDKLLNHLRGNIFHLTNYTNYKNIQNDGVIFNNKDEYFPLNTSSKGSYGRLKGWVCLINLVDFSDVIINNSLMKYNFLSSEEINNTTHINTLVYLIYNSKYSDELIPNSYASENQMVDGVYPLYIPFVECWYPGNLPLEKITKILKVNII